MEYKNMKEVRDIDDAIKVIAKQNKAMLDSLKYIEESYRDNTYVKHYIDIISESITEDKIQIIDDCKNQLKKL